MYIESARKQAMKDYADKKSYVSVIDLKVGDSILRRQQRVKTSDTPYDATLYVITSVKGSRVTATREGKTIVRHKNFFKELKHTPDSQPNVSVGEERHIIPFQTSLSMIKVIRTCSLHVQFQLRERDKTI